MAEAASIPFPYARRPDERDLGDVAFGRSCVATAHRAGDPVALALAVEALARAVTAEAVAKLVFAMASPEQREALVTAFGGGARG